MAANYGGGSVTVVPVLSDGQLGAPSDLIRHSGELGPNRVRQDVPHAHMILPDAGGRFVLANDLSLDKTFIYVLNQDSGKLTAGDPGFTAATPGAGPRHLAYHPSGRYVFVINELNSTLTSFAWDSQRGILNRLHTLSTLPEGFAGISTTAQVVISADGRFVYASNRGHDTIAVFAINQQTGEFAFVDRTHTQGETPRNFNIDPTGNFMYIGHQNTDNIVTFRRDQQTGRLTHTGQFTGTGQPVCLIFSTPPPTGNAVKSGMTFWANPNPVILSGRPASSAQTTLAWNAPGAQEVEIRIGAPDGVNMGRHWYYGTAQAAGWLTDGMTFYLQDVTGGKPLTAENTLAVARVTVRP